VTALVTTFGIRVPADKDSRYKRLKVLLDQAVINKGVHSWFDAVRDTGNKAVHEGFAAQRDALWLVRTRYDLGAWFHRTVTQSREAPPFVPPQPPQPAAPPRDQADAVALAELNDQLGSYRAELVEMRLRLDEQASRATAEAQARREAEIEILAAVRGQGDLHRLVSELTTRFDELSRDLTQRAEAPPRLNAARRDALVEQAQIASRPPLSEVQVRRVIDRILAQAGWVVQDVATTNLRVATEVAVREVTMAHGRADYLLYVDGALVGVIEAKREGFSLIGAERQSDRYAVGLTAEQQVAAWRTPLPFRHESTGVETRFTNSLDPIPCSRRVFAFHQPTTIARWMREAEAEPAGADAVEPRPTCCSSTSGASGWTSHQRRNSGSTTSGPASTSRSGNASFAREHLQDFIDCYLPGKPRDERTETERFKVFEYDELVARDKANLDITWLRDPDAEDSDNLPPPEVIAQEIVDDLQAAINEFAAIADALEAAKAARQKGATCRRARRRCAHAAEAAGRKPA
jgi:type I restriction and modification enzyme subunit R-like protein/uncharacterized protein DUF4145